MCHKSDTSLRQHQKHEKAKNDHGSVEEETEEGKDEESEEDHIAEQQVFTIADLPGIKYEQSNDADNENDYEPVHVEMIYETEILEEEDENAQESEAQEIEIVEEECTIEYETINMGEEEILGDTDSYRTVQANRSTSKVRKPRKIIPRPAVGPPYQCSECQKVLSNLNSYRYHMQLHSDETPFLCNQCGSGFKTRNAYDGHMITHAEVNPHTCNVCGKSYRQAASLRSHMLSHSGLKPFSCEICGKGMTQKSGYKVMSLSCKMPYHQICIILYFAETHAHSFRCKAASMWHMQEKLPLLQQSDYAQEVALGWKTIRVQRKS